MKILSVFLGALFALMTAQAQTPVRLQITHKLGSAPFQLSTQASNNNNNPFLVERLQYYISQIILTHDGGQQTKVPNTWFLIDASTNLDASLGSFNITNLERISFGIGVEEDYNHLDPTLYPADHPLALHVPSMHWGWQGGYRFVAMEGKSGSSLNQGFEFHALGDNVYYQNDIPTAGIQAGGELVIALDADLELAVYNIDLSSGPVVHGSAGEASRMLQNFRDRVFTPALAVGVEEELALELEIGPHPVHAGGTLHLKGQFPAGASLELVNVTGQVIHRQTVKGRSAELLLPQRGLFFVAVKQQGKVLATQKVLVLD